MSPADLLEAYEERVAIVAEGCAVGDTRARHLAWLQMVERYGLAAMLEARAQGL